MLFKFTIKISGTGFLSKLTETQINYILSGNFNDSDGYFNIKEVYNMMSKKPGSRAFRHTLIFRPSIWVLYINNEVKSGEGNTGLYYDFEKCIISDKVSTSDDFKIISIPLNNDIIKHHEIKIKVPKENDKPSEDNLYKLLSVKYGYDLSIIYTIKDKLKWFTPGIYKSLIQKLIRTGCTYIIIDTTNHNSNIVLSVAIILLFMHPGSFVPNIKKFVCGAESLTKRLAVSICEDSYTEYIHIISQLLIASLLIRHNTEFRPNEDIILNWIAVAILAKSDKRAFEYTTNKNLKVISEINYYTFNYIVMTELKSFFGDINMFSTINGNVIKEVGNKLFDTITLEHCFDQHCLPGIGYFYNNNNQEEYEDIFKNIFNCKTGLNTRKLSNLELNSKINTGVYQKIKKSQQLLYLSKTCIPEKRTLLKDTFIFKYELPDSWLSGLVGPLDVRYDSINYIFTIRTDDIYTYNVMRKPSRDDKNDVHITPEEKETVIKIGKGMLSKGIDVITPNYLNLPNKIKIYLLNSDEYYIYHGDNMTTWDNFKILSKIFNYHDNIELTLENFIKYIGDGITLGYEGMISNIFKKYDINVLLRLSNYLMGHKSKIQMNKFNKKGIGQDYMILNIDGIIFEILSYLCIIIPGVIFKKGSTEFKINYGPMLWNIHNKLKEYTTEINISVSKWKMPYDIKDRVPFEHQTDAINKMIENKKQGKSVNLIHIPPGMGKTYIVLKYIKWLIENGRMPTYCVYTLPPSASETIINECKMMGYIYNYLDFTKSNKGDKEIKPYIINIIKHDHLRLNSDELLIKSRDTMFIVDELHKTLSKTIRTSIALNIAENACDLIGMSGTIIKDNDVSILLPWLSLHSDFEVTEKNYWVAIGSMISKKVYTNVSVNRIDYNLDMSDNAGYTDLVSKKMDTLIFKKVIELCYNKCYTTMINKCVSLIKDGNYVFLIAKNIECQELFKKMLIFFDIKEEYIFLIGKGNSIDYKNDDKRDYKVIITTLNYSEGYNLARYTCMLI
jgi:hypothetical protein